MEKLTMKDLENWLGDQSAKELLLEMLQDEYSSESLKKDVMNYKLDEGRV